MIELNKLYCGDCCKLMQEMEPEMVDLVVTSPPYDNLRVYADDDRFDCEAVVDGLWRVVKKGGVVVWVTGDKTHKGGESLTSFRQALLFQAKGFLVHDTMIFAKTNPTPMTHNRYEQSFEYMFVFSKGRPKTFNPLKVPLLSPRKVQIDVHHTNNYKRGNSKRGHNKEKIKGNVWFYKVGKYHSSSDPEAFEHPAIFPEQLVEDHILSWSNEGDLVFDPMCGSGTTCKVAKLLDRNYLGFDRSSKYIEKSTERVKRF